MQSTLRFAPGVVDLASLGDATARAWLLAEPTDLDTRARLLSRRQAPDAAEHLRLPLPGTPGSDGRRSGPPRGSGTGWLHLYRYAGGGRDGLVARLTAPRSSSLAARHWNLICHLRAQGVGAPELVMLGEGDASTPAAAGPDWDSFVVTRELAGFTPLRDLIRSGLGGRRRRLALRSVGLALRGLFRAGAWLPHMAPENILVQVDESLAPGACGGLELESLQRDARTLRSLGLRRTRLPAVAFTEFRRARLLKRMSVARQVRLLESLGRGLPSGVGRIEQLSVRALALG